MHGMGLSKTKHRIGYNDWDHHCKKSRRFSRRVNGRVADITSKPAYSKQHRQPDQLRQAVFIFWVGINKQNKIGLAVIQPNQ
jgi:hypothetical protein